jgi:Ca-activated chloride channel family protein
LKTIFSILLCLLCYACTYGQQYYLRGEVRDESGNPLQNVTIRSHATGYVYRSGTMGSFGIISSKHIDTFSFSMDGYRREITAVNADHYLTVRLKLQPLSSVNTSRFNKLQSITRGMVRDDHRKWFAGDETYASIVENKFIHARQFPNTGLSLNVDRASYSNIRRFLNMNSIVPPDAVRVEEMLNYFNLRYKPPAANKLFEVETQITDCPWNPLNRLYYINLSARKLNLDSLPPTHLVFLIDVSGSMDMPNRLPLLQSAFRMLVSNLRARDSVTMVVYGGVTGVMLHTTSGSEQDSIMRAIDKLTPGGSTPGESGIRLAYALARSHFIKGGNNRVILATDGDFNVGIRTEEELDEMITRHRESGIYLTCLGVGMGNYKDSKIQTLARKGNGNFAYLDQHGEAEKVLMREFTQTLYAVADDAYMNVEFNPAFVRNYRLIGFDNKMGALSDTMSMVEGGEIGSGYAMTGIFEIEPASADSVVLERFAELQLRYRLSGDTQMHYFSHNSFYNYQPLTSLDSSFGFAASVALFGSMLKQSEFTNKVSWNDLTLLASRYALRNDIQQQEFLTLIAKARELYDRKKGRKKKN